VGVGAMVDVGASVVKLVLLVAVVTVLTIKVVVVVGAIVIIVTVVVDPALGRFEDSVTAMLPSAGTVSSIWE
jgi:hypothetical protein